jgi:hypothetical protein
MRRDAGQRTDVARSSAASQRSASSRLPPHISGAGRRPTQTRGRSARPKIAHALSSVSLEQRTPAGLPAGIPGIALEIDGAMQHAPQPGRQFMRAAFSQQPVDREQ